MAGSWKLGRWFGIDVRIHFTFALLLAALAGVNLWTGGPQAMASSLFFTLALFGSVLLHEFGHALAARRYGIGTRDITLLPIGGVAQLEGMPQRPLHEAVVALAGPAVNVAIALVLGAWLWLTGTAAPLESLGATTGPLAERLLLTNVGLLLFNLVPAFPMDGGRVLRALLSWRMGALRATRIAAKVGRGLAVVFGIAGLFGNPMLILIAFFVWMAAGAERREMELKASLGEAPVARLAHDALPAVSPTDRLVDAAQGFLATNARALPVAEGGRVVGALMREDLLAGLARLGPSALVASVPVAPLPDFGATTPLSQALPKLGGPGLAVVQDQNGNVLGLVSTDQVLLFAAFSDAIRDFEQGRRMPVATQDSPARG